MSFATLGLAPEFLRAVADQGYTEPTPVQAESIPLVLEGRDLMANAQTGTGKTAAFVLPMLQNMGPPNIDPRSGRRPIRALVLAPTRELALQVEESVRVYGRHWGVRSAAIYGGVGFPAQANALRRGVDVVVATPGRLLDHLGQRTIDLSTVEILVLDEADRMLDMGFIRDIRKVLDVLPARRQNLLFSATFSEEIRSLARGFLHDPASVQVTPRNSATPLVTQVVHLVDRERKRELLSHLIRTGAIDQALVFTRTKHGANRLAEQLGRDGISAVAIHGNKSQGQRVRALADFKTGRTPILVATEIAARGLDIDGLPHVVNYELPMVAEDYVHRIGRTGRAGSPGHAVSLVCVDELKLLGEIQRVLGATVPQEIIAGFEPDRSIRPEPILRGGLGRGRPDPRGPRVGGHADRGGYAGARRPSPAFHPGQGGSAQGRPAQARPAHPGQPDPAQAYAAQGRPAQGRPAQGRPAHGRPGPQRPGQQRPGQGIGNGGPGGGPRSGGPRPGGHASGRPQVIPGERFARSERRG
ncbi:MAG TPA: DEAD/DEAH box helicase [Methylomirabilota bacterium]|nr:DEAD/DEAH box helicase [Methylomirabilota bacterium]